MDYFYRIVLLLFVVVSNFPFHLFAWIYSYLHTHFNVISVFESSPTCKNKMERNEFRLIRYGRSRWVRTAWDQGPRSGSVIQSQQTYVHTYISFPFVNPICRNQYRLYGNSWKLVMTDWCRTDVLTRSNDVLVYSPWIDSQFYCHRIRMVILSRSLFLFGDTCSLHW
jgi:hypothetical protein